MLSQLVTPSSRPCHARVTPSWRGVTVVVWNAWHYSMYTKSLSGLLCCSCATGKQADCRATRGPGRAGKHTYSRKSSSFKLESNEYLLRQPPSFCNAKKDMLLIFQMRYLTPSYSQKRRFKLNRKQGNNFRRIFGRSRPPPPPTRPTSGVNRTNIYLDNPQVSLMPRKVCFQSFKWDTSHLSTLKDDNLN